MCATTGDAISLENHVAAILRAEFAFSSKLFVVWKEILCGGRPRGIAFFGRNFSNIIIIVVVVIIIAIFLSTSIIIISRGWPSFISLFKMQREAQSFGFG